MFRLFFFAYFTLRGCDNPRRVTTAGAAPAPQ
ncbi:hypothetical protein FHW11_000124 [Pantoea agglomerans]|nr:hypothetical protein [Pantoea agglomerans]MBA8890677.1 hypothetical protein [Pantoea agglomerans]MDF9910897.1 hypothetical protein [Pantoea brenneri]